MVDPFRGEYPFGGEWPSGLYSLNYEAGTGLCCCLKSEPRWVTFWIPGQAIHERDDVDLRLPYLDVTCIVGSKYLEIGLEDFAAYLTLNNECKIP